MGRIGRRVVAARKLARGAALAGGVALAAGGAGLGAAPAGASTGAAAAAQPVTVQVWLKPGLNGAATFADSVATPGNPGFHRYLSPDGYTARFGAPATHARAVAAWLTSQKLTQVRISPGRDYVSATGPISKLTVPASLAADVLGVTGLSNTAAGSGHTAARADQRPSAAPAPNCSQYWGQYTLSFHPAFQGLTRGSRPVCGYSAGQLRAVYGATAAATGRGQTVALTEDVAPAALFRTMTDWARANHLPAPKPAQFHQTSAGGSCGNDADRATTGHTASGPPVDDEAQMDAEAVYAMAPAASQLMVVGTGCDEDQSLLDAALSVLTGNGAHPSASIESNSWQIPLGEVPPQIPQAIDLRAAAEGVGVYFASGDTPGLTATDADPYATVVGGSSLGLGARGNRIFETGWSDEDVFWESGQWADEGVSGGGGGTSLVYGQPAYQKGVVPASMSRVRVGQRTVTDRAVPDLATDADLDTGMQVGYIQTGTDAQPGPYRTAPNAGTSLATPLVAGLVADAQQGQPSAYGFINPLLYRLAGTAAFHDSRPVNATWPQPDRDAYTPAAGGASAEVDVFDTQGRDGTQQVTAPGYDTMTGLGTPGGAAFITGLRRGAGS